MMDFKDELTNVFQKHNIPLSHNQISQFEVFFNLLIEWNKKMNLTAITEQKEVITKHFLDSVLPQKILKMNCSVIDIGCGAGFPSLPLKILRPDLKFTLVDSVQKKLSFVQKVINKLELKDINVIHFRAEDLATKKEYRENFDVCLARAVAELNVLSEYCLPFVKIRGIFLAYKSQNVEEELKNSKVAIETFGGDIQKIENFEYENANRSVVVIKKITQTPNKYPRDKNKPRLNPIV